MTKIATVENDAVYEGYDNSTAVQWYSPTFLGCSVCVGASAVKGLVTITLGLNTPFGNVSKNFSFNSNVNYSWQPFSKFKISVSITNFNEAGGVFSFDLGLNPCIDIPFLGWKCTNFSHHFNVPLVLAGIHNDIDDSQFASVMAFHTGNGFNDAGGSSLLQGDIYSSYLNSQAGVPTLPVASCIPTRQCVPTITSCITGIPFICNSALQGTQGNTANVPTLPYCMPTIPANQCGFTATLLPGCHASGLLGANAANFPTLPVNQCIPTAQCVPTLSCIPTISCTGIPFICNSALQGGYPTTLLPGCQHTTTLLPGCQQGGTQETQDANANVADVYTIPVASCIPTRQCVPTITSCVTGIPFICNSALQGDYPTTLLPGCQSGDVQGLKSNANAADFPTISAASCIPTRQCNPTITSCPSGIPFICNSALQSGYPTTVLPGCQQHTTTLLPGCQHGGLQANAAAIPTLPVSTCVNTASCYPTLSCIPTVSCTGIPFIC